MFQAEEAVCVKAEEHHRVQCIHGNCAVWCDWSKGCLHEEGIGNGAEMQTWATFRLTLCTMLRSQPLTLE